MGSSPLTRGKYEAGMLALAWGRLIPAHAGKITSALPFVSARRAHPRSRGENVGKELYDLGARGSSPLTRGKCSQRLHAEARAGLIPAHAGKIPVASFTYPATWAHPRSRGENSLCVIHSSALVGSSPLTRGKLVVIVVFSNVEGLIPAHAGKIYTSRKQPC